MNNKIQIELGSVQETLMLPLWGRAMEAKKHNPMIADTMALDILNKLDYDFTKLEKNLNEMSQICWVVRALHVDRIVHSFLDRYPSGMIVNIGCGLDTTYERIACRNTGKNFTFLDLDLPDVVALRTHFFKDDARRKTLSVSFLDKSWMENLKRDTPVLIVGAGVFYYFEENVIKQFFKSVSDRVDYGEFYFDAVSPVGMKNSNKKVLSATSLKSGEATLKWAVKDIADFEKWDSRIKVIKHPPVFKGLKRGVKVWIKLLMLICDSFGMMVMPHLVISNKKK